MRLEDEIQQYTFKNEYHKLSINLMLTGSWLNQLIKNWLDPFGLTKQQFNILRILRGQYPEPAKVSLLAERMLDKMSNASRLVEKLRIKGLVERTGCEHDRRAVDVKITQAGLDLLDRIDATSDIYEEKFMTLSEKEARQLNRLLDKMRG
ncbi:MAG TPA: MarR family transcriptional regulator [Bacteroidetes bacterium]|nr:MarR family transcriptional regulator [Bacteroidota bacterium]